MPAVNSGTRTCNSEKGIDEGEAHVLHYEPQRVWDRTQNDTAQEPEV